MIAILALAAVGVGLLFWMGLASRAGEALSTVTSIGLTSVALIGIAAALAVRFARRP